ncbi:MAG: hypothetical protein KA004_18230 [Verrucomicrobiales bacterium]|nr:hypothetical protein [Verrucomicrobiales bacterium]
MTKRTRCLLLTLVSGTAVFSGVVGLRWWRDRHPDLPGTLMQEIPAGCRQVLLVLAPDRDSIPARLWRMERGPAGGWRTVSGSIPVSLGRSGLAWGVGRHQSGPPAGWLTKREGDGRSPAGIFSLPFAFGSESAAPWLRLRYVMCTPTLAGVDDPKSRFYNQVVEAAEVSRDWDSAEIMRRGDGLYRWGAFVAHNPQNSPGAGSCIFLHLWRGPGQPTAGCTAMAEEDLLTILSWLDPAAEPCLVQTVAP